jgi:hypothetical protein
VAESLEKDVRLYLVLRSIKPAENPFRENLTRNGWPLGWRTMTRPFLPAVNSFCMF